MESPYSAIWIRCDISQPQVPTVPCTLALLPDETNDMQNLSIRTAIGTALHYMLCIRIAISVWGSKEATNRNMYSNWILFIISHTCFWVTWTLKGPVTGEETGDFT
jgi:hypothetical protein